MRSHVSPTDFAKAVANIDAHFAARRPGPPVARSTPEQMAAARAAARAFVTHDGLPPGQRLVNGDVYVFNMDSRSSDDVEALLASRALQMAAE